MLTTHTPTKPSVMKYVTFLWPKNHLPQGFEPDVFCFFPLASYITALYL